MNIFEAIAAIIFGLFGLVLIIIIGIRGHREMKEMDERIKNRKKMLLYCDICEPRFETYDLAEWHDHHINGHQKEKADG